MANGRSKAAAKELFDGILKRIDSLAGNEQVDVLLLLTDKIDVRLDSLPEFDEGEEESDEDEDEGGEEGDEEDEEEEKDE